ncbi:MAG: FAD-dependent oxidoreductase, partial [Gammaproteobacteria bacterium]|nr:FAD-dependent oxidoreductase [Gammaproteobacteria bacterium]
MNGQYDVVVIGGGHNGLTTACLVAKTGKRVALVEKRETLGG